MGSLTYDSVLTINFDDRVLAHLQIVMNTKLRRRESFFFTWIDDPKIGNGRSVISIDARTPLMFKYAGRTPTINKRWIQELTNLANSAQGLQLVPEPTTTARHDSLNSHGVPD
jgi:hypothetical protein